MGHGPPVSHAPVKMEPLGPEVRRLCEGTALPCRLTPLVPTPLPSIPVLPTLPCPHSKKRPSWSSLRCQTSRLPDCRLSSGKRCCISSTTTDDRRKPRLCEHQYINDKTGQPRARPAFFVIRAAASKACLLAFIPIPLREAPLRNLHRYDAPLQAGDGVQIVSHRQPPVPDKKGVG